MSKVSPSIVVFRRDLRLDDNPALNAAIDRGGAVLPVFIWSPDEEMDWAPGSASRYWLHQSLKSLEKDLRAMDSRLILRCGAACDVLDDLAKETNADAVFWNRQYEPASIAQDPQLEKQLRGQGLIVESFNGSLLFEPGEISTQKDEPYKVFTPFWKACCASEPPEEPEAKPSKIPAPKKWPKSDPLSDLGLEPEIDWAKGIRESWQPGAKGAHDQLERFIENALVSYEEDRNRPDIEGSSRLSPHLHFGEISPRQVWNAVQSAKQAKSKSGKEAKKKYLAELGWREFAHHLLYHFPHLTDQPMREEFADFPWEKDSSALRAWQRGKTGYPIVDAAMRELWVTGWMHNRARMIVASFLVKDLLQPWQEGAKWFWDTLVDADLANNTLGWQWVAGCGPDASPYFRVFNPVSQGQRFDPEGEYVRKWLPALERLPTKWIHQPWEAPASVLEEAEVQLGDNYPEPMVDHASAREAALEALEAIKTT